MPSVETTRVLARQLYEARKHRVQIRHFPMQQPDMTIGWLCHTASQAVHTESTSSNFV